jgi:hypothetical protein
VVKYNRLTTKDPKAIKKISQSKNKQIESFLGNSLEEMLTPVVSIFGGD